MTEGGAADPALTGALEAGLCTFHHDRLARELGQLAPAEVWPVADARPILARLAAHRGQGAGEAKSDRLEMWPVPASSLDPEAGDLQDEAAPV